MNDLQSTASALTTADTPVAQVLRRMFPKALVVGEEHGHTVGSCREEQLNPPHAQIQKKKTIPVDGAMLATASTISSFGRCRWFLMEVGEVYVIIKMNSAQAGFTHAEVVHCVLSAVTEREKFALRQHFQKYVAGMNGGPIAEPASFYPGRGH